MADGQSENLMEVVELYSKLLKEQDDVIGWLVEQVKKQAYEIEHLKTIAGIEIIKEQQHKAKSLRALFCLEGKNVRFLV